MQKNTKKLIICRGIQGSGKSTWAKQFIHDNGSDKWVRVNNDDIRNMLGDYWVPDREKLVAKIYKETIMSAIESGYNVIVDNMNLNPKTIKELESLCKYYYDISIGTETIEIEYKDFFIPLDQCIANDLKRSNPIGSKVIKQTWRRYAPFIVSQINKAIINNERKVDSDKASGIIVDIDGTIARNIVGRDFYGKNAYSRYKSDLPIWPVIEIIQSYAERGKDIIFVTGRDGCDESRDATIEWLSAHEFNDIDYILHMRDNNSSIPAPEYKKSVYENVIAPYYNIEMVFDDDQRCVDMWRDLGLNCLQMK